MGKSNPDSLVRHVAAVQLATHSPADLPAAAVRELLDTLLQVSRPPDGSPLASEYAEATDDGDSSWDLGQHIALALAGLPAGSADFAVPDLIALWRRDRQFYEVALAAVARSFPEGGRPVAAALSESQEAVLSAIADDDALWSYYEIPCRPWWHAGCAARVAVVPCVRRWRRLTSHPLRVIRSLSCADRRRRSRWHQPG